MNLDRFRRILGRMEYDYPDDDDRPTLERAKAYVDNHIHRADIVQQLPAQSEPAYFYVVPGDTNLYIGGPGGSYRRIPTQAL